MRYFISALLIQVIVPFLINVSPPVCDQISGGCSAAHSVTRQLESSYSGSLFQLSRVSGGGGTQNIGFLSNGLVNTSAIGSFCGSGSTGPNAGPGTNSCAYHIIYDQSGNSNDLTAVNGDTPYSTDANSQPILNIDSESTRYFFNNPSPTNVPTLNTQDKTVLAVFNDSMNPWCCGIYGVAHDPSGPDITGTDWLISTFGPNNPRITSGQYDQQLWIDLEQDSARLTYAPNFIDYGGTYTGFGLVVGLSTWTHTTNGILLQVNNGEALTQTYGSLGTTAEVRLASGGDGSGVRGLWYEGIILSHAATSGERTTLNSNIMSFYGISQGPSCSNGLTPLDTLGRSNILSLGGLRVLNSNYNGPLIQVKRNDNGNTQDILSSGCDLNVSQLSTFCSGTTCTVAVIYNQIRDQTTINNYGAGQWVTLYDMASNALWGGSSGPSITFSCLGAHPCASFSSSNALTSGSTFTPPLSYFISSNRTSVSAGVGLGVNTTKDYLGYASGSNTAAYLASTGSATATASDNTFHSLSGVTTSSTGITLYVDGTGTSATVTTDTNVSNLYIGGASLQFNGLEFVTSSTALTGTQISAISSAAKSYWGY